ncbi:hypothetical protein [Nonomuraea polychroma]|uniref:hypothetical protein n=1 Tax=Nonomuraea polychroma TaxID=46176 RepID=UPI0013E324ED|nr:hypothetical protein [Nonomuraea polychroma]
MALPAPPISKNATHAGKIHTVSASEAAATIMHQMTAIAFATHSYTNRNGIRQGGWVKTKEDPLNPLNPHEETTTRTRALPIHPLPLDEGGTGYSSRAHLHDAASATLLTTQQSTIVRDEPAAVRDRQPDPSAA